MENNYDNLSEENFLSGRDKKNAFGIPKGYFNSLSSRMLNKIECQQELAEFKTLAATDRQLKFAVPQNYFSSLATILEYKYELSVYSELAKVTKPVLKTLPANYFSMLKKKVMERIELDAELKEFSVLSSLEKKNNFKLVPDYFENNTDEVKEKIHAAKHRVPDFIDQVISLLFKPKMAFALSFVLIIGFTAVWYLNKTNPVIQSGACKTLACLEKNELLNENNVRDFDDENLYDMVDVDVLDKNMSGKDVAKDSLKTKKTTK